MRGRQDLRLRRRVPTSPPRQYPDLKTDVSRSHLRLHLDGRWATARGEAFLPGYGSPDFEIYRNQIAWENGTPMSDDERERILQTLLAAARERGLEIEIL